MKLIHQTGPLLVFIACCSLAIAMEKPNILWISCEDMSPYLGCYGDKQARTPNLDKLASEGARFTNVFSTAPVCAPSRSALITGMYATTMGTHHMRSKGVPPPYVKCFPEYLRASGYYCTNNSKTDYNFDPPLTAWDQNGQRAHWRNRPPNTPFFAVFNLITTHEGKFHLNDNEVEEFLAPVPKNERHDPTAVPVPPYLPDTPVVRKDVARHYDLITAMDKQAGELLSELERDGLSSNTIVFFFSDHGSAFPRGKRWIYDSGLHVPLIVRWPGTLQPGSVRTEMVSFVDFAPTILTITGISAPTHMQGHAFLGPKTKSREYIFAARDRMDETYDIIRCVRDRQYKYIRNFEPQKPYAQTIKYGEKTPALQELRRLHASGGLNAAQELFFRPQKPLEELYDLASDPHELHDLTSSTQHQETLKRLRAELEGWRKDSGDLGLVPEAELQERMRPGGQWAVTAPPDIAISSVGNVKTVTIQSPTQGASIAYKKQTRGDNSRWLLYSSPIKVDDETTITAKVCRLGYKDSNEVAHFIGKE